MATEYTGFHEPRLGTVTLREEIRSQGLVPDDVFPSRAENAPGLDAGMALGLALTTSLVITSARGLTFASPLFLLSLSGGLVLFPVLWALLSVRGRTLGGFLLKTRYIDAATLRPAPGTASPSACWPPRCPSPSCSSRSSGSRSWRWCS